MMADKKSVLKSDMVAILTKFSIKPSTTASKCKLFLTKGNTFGYDIFSYSRVSQQAQSGEQSS
jgi:hypothetical protein